jgi:hypothetical protein
MMSKTLLYIGWIRNFNKFRSPGKFGSVDTTFYEFRVSVKGLGFSTLGFFHQTIPPRALISRPKAVSHMASYSPRKVLEAEKSWGVA